MSGYIYAVECGGRVKIGFSEDPQKRFNKIASDAPFPAVLLGYWYGSVADELAFQEQFKAIRVHGEWFASTENLLGAIADNVIPIGTKNGRFNVQDGDGVLAVWRKNKKISQAEVADDLGVTQATWSRWEKQTLRVPAERVVDIEKVTGISRAEIRPDIFGESA